MKGPKYTCSLTAPTWQIDSCYRNIQCLPLEGQELAMSCESKAAPHGLSESPPQLQQHGQFVELQLTIVLLTIA